MCLIIYAPSGVPKDSEFLTNVVIEAAEENPDGFGYAVKSKKEPSPGTKSGEGNNGDEYELFYSKGFFKIESLLEDLEILQPDIDSEVAIHCRIGNKGFINGQMCHPFEISKKKDNLVKLDGKNPAQGIMFHNGTFDIFVGTKQSESDTYLFARDYLSDDAINELLFNHTDSFEKLSGKVLRMSRLLVMHHDKDTVSVGNWYEEDGLFFSKDIRKEWYLTPSKEIPRPKKPKRTYYNTTKWAGTEDHNASYGIYDHIDSYGTSHDYDYYDTRNYSDSVDTYTERNKRKSKGTNSKVGRVSSSDTDDLLDEIRKDKQKSLNLTVNDSVKTSNKKPRLRLLGNNLYLPYEDGFNRKALNPIHISFDDFRYLESIMINKTNYFNVLGVLVPIDVDSTVEDYKLVLNNTTKDMVTLFGKVTQDPVDEVFGAVTKGRQYWIDDIDHHGNVLLSVAGETDDSISILTDLVDIYHDYMICPKQEHRNILKELEIMGRKIERSYDSLIKLDKLVNEADKENLKNIYFGNSLVFTKESCMIYMEELMFYLDKKGETTMKLLN